MPVYFGTYCLPYAKGNAALSFLSVFLTQNNLRCSVEPGLDVGVNPLMFITAGTKVYDLRREREAV